MSLPVCFIGGWNRKHNVRVGEFLHTIYSHPLFAFTPRHLIRRALRWGGAGGLPSELYRMGIWKTVAINESGDNWQIAPESWGRRYEELVAINKGIVDGSDENAIRKKWEPIPVRRIYVAPLHWRVDALLYLCDRAGLRRCKCGKFLKPWPDRKPLPDDDARPVVCEKCDMKRDAADAARWRWVRRVKRLASVHFHKDEKLAEAHLLLRELKQEIRSLTK